MCRYVSRAPSCAQLPLICLSCLCEELDLAVAAFLAEGAVPETVEVALETVEAVPGTVLVEAVDLETVVAVPEIVEVVLEIVEVVPGTVLVEEVDLEIVEAVLGTVEVVLEIGQVVAVDLETAVVVETVPEEVVVDTAVGLHQEELSAVHEQSLQEGLTR